MHASSPIPTHATGHRPTTGPGGATVTTTSVPQVVAAFTRSPASTFARGLVNHHGRLHELALWRPHAVGLAATEGTGTAGVAPRTELHLAVDPDALGAFRIAHRGLAPWEPLALHTVSVDQLPSHLVDAADLSADDRLVATTTIGPVEAQLYALVLPAHLVSMLAPGTVAHLCPCGSALAAHPLERLAAAAAVNRGLADAGALFGPARLALSLPRPGGLRRPGRTVPRPLARHGAGPRS